MKLLSAYIESKHTLKQQAMSFDQQLRAPLFATTIVLCVHGGVGMCDDSGIT